MWTSAKIENEVAIPAHGVNLCILISIFCTWQESRQGNIYTNSTGCHASYVGFNELIFTTHSKKEELYLAF